MKAILIQKPTKTTNLLAEARLIKTALLFTEEIYFQNKEITVLLDVYNIDESQAIESQYKTIIDAIPVLNPESSTDTMVQSLQQIRQLKNNKKRSSREIIAYKKAQKKLLHVNDTFKIITKVLFDSSQLDAILRVNNLKIDFTDNLVYKQEPYLFILSANTIPAEDLDKITIMDSIKFDDFTIDGITKAQKAITFEDALDLTNIDLEISGSILKKKLSELKFDNKETNRKDKKRVSIHLASCSSIQFQTIIRQSNYSNLNYSISHQKQYFIYVDCSEILTEKKKNAPVLINN